MNDWDLDAWTIDVMVRKKRKRSRSAAQLERKLAKAIAIVHRCRPFIFRALNRAKAHEQDIADAQAIEDTIKATFPREWERR